MKHLPTVLLCACLAVLAALPALGADQAAPAPAAKSAQAAATSAAPDSLKLLEKAVAKDSTKFDNLYRLGVMYLDKDQVDNAYTVLTKAHVLRPRDHRVMVNLGAALDAGGRANEAQGYYREALQASPGDSVASCRLASSLYAQSKYSDAVDILRGVIKDTPHAYCAYFTLGVAFADAGIYKDAIRMWRKVVDLAPTSPEAVSARESIEVLEKFTQQQ